MRAVTVSSASFAHSTSREEGLSRAKGLIERALPQKPDVIVLPECFANDIGTAESVPGPITDAMAEIAKANACYIAVPLYEKVGAQIYNSCVMLDRQGAVAYTYHKLFPVDSEIKGGTTPGTSAKVIETDFGRVGLAICFDLNFREVIQGYADQGAELILFTSAYEGGRQLATWALDYGVFVVSSHWGGIGCIVDKTGHVLEQGSSWLHPVVTRVLNLDSQVFHLDYNFNYLDAIRKEYGPAIRIHADVPEARCVIESVAEGLDVLSIRDAYGLELYADYMARSRKVRAQALADPASVAKHLRADNIY